jgi:hypothetical protein
MECDSLNFFKPIKRKQTGVLSEEHLCSKSTGVFNGQVCQIVKFFPKFYFDFKISSRTSKAPDTSLKSD